MVESTSGVCRQCGAPSVSSEVQLCWTHFIREHGWPDGMRMYLDSIGVQYTHGNQGISWSPGRAIINHRGHSYDFGVINVCLTAHETEIYVEMPEHPHAMSSNGPLGYRMCTGSFGDDIYALRMNYNPSGLYEVTGLIPTMYNPRSAYRHVQSPCELCGAPGTYTCEHCGKNVCRRHAGIRCCAACGTWCHRHLRYELVVSERCGVCGVPVCSHSWCPHRDCWHLVCAEHVGDEACHFCGWYCNHHHVYHTLPLRSGSYYRTYRRLACQHCGRDVCQYSKCKKCGAIVCKDCLAAYERGCAMCGQHCDGCGRYMSEVWECENCGKRFCRTCKRRYSDHRKHLCETCAGLEDVVKAIRSS